MDADQVERMRAASGEFVDDDPLVAFLYLLMRNEVAMGVVEELMVTVEQGNKPWVFTNGWLARYAYDVAGRLKK